MPSRRPSKSGKALPQGSHQPPKPGNAKSAPRRPVPPARRPRGVGESREQQLGRGIAGEDLGARDGDGPLSSRRRKARRPTPGVRTKRSNRRS